MQLGRGVRDEFADFDVQWEAEYESLRAVAAGIEACLLEGEEEDETTAAAAAAAGPGVTTTAAAPRQAQAPDGTRGFRIARGSPAHRAQLVRGQRTIEREQAVTEELRSVLIAAIEEGERVEEDDDLDDALFFDCVSLPAPDAATSAAIQGLRGIVTPEEICAADGNVLAARSELRVALVQAQEQEDARARRRHAAAAKAATAVAAAAAAATAATAAAAAATAAAATAAAAVAAAAVAQEELHEQELELEQQEQQELELGREPAAGMEAVELGDGGCTPAPKRGERLVSSPPGDEPLPPAVRLRRFQVLERHHSSGDTTVIDRDRLKHTHTSGVRPTSGKLL
jgi:hypothetical protein